MSFADHAKLRTTIEATVRGCLTAHRDAAALGDAGVACRGLAPGCAREVVPASVLRSLLGGGGGGGGPPKPARLSNEEYRAHVERDLAVLAVARTDVLDLTVDVPARKAAARSTNVVRFLGGGGGGGDGDGDADGEEEEEEMSLEFAWFFDLDGDGTHVTRVVEVVDTAEIVKFTKKVEELWGKKKEEEEATDAP